jgi:hypothetical protein
MQRLLLKKTIHHREQDTTNKMNNDAPGNLLDRPELPELSVNGAELSVNGSSPHIDDQPPEPPADRDGYPMKHYCVEVIFETGDWTDGWACGRCEDAQLIAGKIVLCLGVEAHTRSEALSKALTAARTALHDGGTAALGWENTLTKLVGGPERFLDSGTAPTPMTSWPRPLQPDIEDLGWPSTPLIGTDGRVWVGAVGVHLVP